MRYVITGGSGRSWMPTPNENVLDAPYQVTQGSVLREFYRTGRSVSLGMSWQ